MKKNRPWKEQMVSALELPADLAYSEPIVTLTGTTEALIENYKCILVYTESEIVILTLRGKVSICGKNLEILWYTPQEMKITGTISAVFPQKLSG